MCISTFLLAALYSQPITICYDGDGDGDDTGDAGDGDGAAGAGDGEESQGSGSTGTFTQDDVNKFLADDRRKHAAKMKSLEDKLTSTLKTAQLTLDERKELETSLEDAKKLLMTKEQVAASEKKKLATQYETQLNEFKARAEQFESRFTDSTIKRALSDAAALNDAFNPEQIVTLLRPHTKLVDEKPVVDFNDRHVETGESIVTQLSPEDAVKRMRELSEVHGNLFRSNVVTGVGSNSGQPHGGAINKSKLTPEQYAKLRKENPGALGFRK